MQTLFTKKMGFESKYVKRNILVFTNISHNLLSNKAYKLKIYTEYFTIQCLFYATPSLQLGICGC